MKTNFSTTRFLIATVMLWSVFTATAQGDKGYINSIIRHQDSLRAVYSNPETTILKGKELTNFKGLEFYPIKANFRVSARFKRTPNEEPFLMATSAGVPREYVKYGEVSFDLDDNTYTLNIYQNPLFIKTPNHKYADYLMLGFTDYTSGNGSYGGGRYINMRISQIVNDRLIVDFNKSYNPYCAYTTGYACAIPPEANDLKLRVEAGIKAYDEDH